MERRWASPPVLISAIHVAHARSKGLRRRMPPVLRRRAIDAAAGSVFTMTRWPTVSSAHHHAGH